MVLQLTMPLGMLAYRQEVEFCPTQRKDSKQSAVAGVHGCSDGVRRHVVLSRVNSIRRNQILRSFLFIIFSRSFRGRKLRGTISPATGQASPIHVVGERLEMMQLMSHSVSFGAHFR